ncbi:MAG: prepilin-type N-terminal cleavage/methylation domain-containing protein [Desulfomonilia bacterium]
MKRGMTLIEVMVALVVIMVLFMAMAKIAVVAIRSDRYAEVHTRAALMCHEALLKLQGLTGDPPELEAGWHEDPGNPIEQDNERYYRFWQVAEAEAGREVTLVVAWNDGSRHVAPGSFSSVEGMKQSGCPYVALHDIIP